MAKQYTAKEMRAFADAIAGDLCGNGHSSVEYTYDDLIPVIDSLRQAADALEREGNKCGDCAKFGSDCSAGDVDGNEDCSACDKFISKETAAKDEENATLRALVGKLANALKKIDDMCDGDMCKYFDSNQHCSKCGYIHTCETGVAHSTLKTHESEIYKAMEMIEKERAKDVR